MKYLIHPRCKANIYSFYHNVARKYANTYPVELMHKNASEAISSIYKIENGLLRRKATREIWSEYYMANTKKWYFAYKIIGDTIIVLDACHAQNMR